MSNELKQLATKAAKGLVSRRDFLGRAGALGITAVGANAMLASAAKAAGPNKGGHLVQGIGGGESSNSLDPALTASSVPFGNLKHFGDLLVQIRPDGVLEPRLAESVEATSDAKTWTFKIRKGVEFHNGKTMTPDDVLKTMQRHSNEDATSGALGIMKGIESMKVDGDNFSVTLTTPNADLPYLMSD
ncbi:MAG: twin-arginine translocation signal domain-containing protein, partial [Amylibacter sp.]|nr:twin-arginine translocation signal domain-containing protein [Amylibacter sp.]